MSDVLTRGSRYGKSTKAIAVGVDGLTLGCAEETPFDPGTGREPINDVQSSRMMSKNPDPLAMLAEHIPGFGGLFLSPDEASRENSRTAREGNLYLTISADHASAVSQTREFLRENGIEPKSIRILPAAYSYSDLLSWKTDLKNVLSIGGVVMLDLDESRNDLFVGVLEPSVESLVRAFAKSAGVPARSLRVGVVRNVVRASTLQDYKRPVEGGRQIEFGAYYCSLGVNASLSSSFTFAADSERTFITASHCTATQGGVESTQFYQGTGFIGIEIADPTYFTGGACPTDRRCRYSDAAMVAYDTGASWEPAGVARVTSGITVSSTQPVVQIESERVALVNSSVGHLGRTTGWNSGSVTSTCIDVNVSTSDITQLCQVKVHATLQPGDSGGPVLAYYNLYPTLPNGAWSAYLYGIAWAYTGTTDFFYSPISAVHSELGTFQAACASFYFC